MNIQVSHLTTQFFFQVSYNIQYSSLNKSHSIYIEQTSSMIRTNFNLSGYRIASYIIHYNDCISAVMCIMSALTCTTIYMLLLLIHFLYMKHRLDKCKMHFFYIIWKNCFHHLSHINLLTKKIHTVHILSTCTYTLMQNKHVPNII